VYIEKKRERRRRDLVRRKARVRAYGWYDPRYASERIVGIAANTNHTCGRCAMDRKWFGPPFSEVRARARADS
jgi:hypothetical protein